MTRDGLFREDAIRARRRGRPLGDVVRVAPRWVAPTLTAVVMAFVGAALLLVVGHMDRFRTGTAVVRLEEVAIVAAPTGGPTRRIAVVAGQRVQAGETIAWIDNLQLRARLRQVELAIESATQRALFDGSDTAAVNQLSDLRSRQREIELELSAHELVAPCDGVVVDISVRLGARVEIGDEVASIAPDERQMQIIGVFPGRDLSALRRGQTGFVEFDGVPGTRQQVRLAAVSPQIMGSKAVDRMLGARLADTISIEGPVAVVTAPLPNAAVRVGDNAYELRDGAGGTIAVATETERVIFAVFPSLREAKLPW